LVQQGAQLTWHQQDFQLELMSRMLEKKVKHSMKRSLPEQKALCRSPV
jgi:hypothetical protein